MTALFRNGGRRILALWFPHLPSDRIFRRRLGRSWRCRRQPVQPPLVFSWHENNTQRIATLDERAEALALRVGMGIADARAMHPAIEVLEAEPEADRKVLEGLADWCDRYTPLVALDPPDGLYLDITGCAHLFGGEKPMLDDLLMRLFEQGFDVRAGLASTPGAAWAAARFGAASAIPGEVGTGSPAGIAPKEIIAAGEEETLLAPLPLAALRLDAAVIRSLESVGLRTAGAILSAPRAPLVRRFGRELLMRLDQAVGRLEEAISPRLPVPPLSVERALAEPIVLSEEIESLVGLLAGTLKTDLERRDEGARRLQLALFRVDAAVCRIEIGTSRPLREPRLIKRLFHERLAVLGSEIDAGFGFELVRLSALAVAPFAIEQTDLSGRANDDGEALALFADRVRARLGREALSVPAAVASHLPERAVRLAPFAEAGVPLAAADAGFSSATAQDEGPAAAAATEGRVRPVRLLRRPEPVDVSASEVPEGPPKTFRWRRAIHRVTRAEGPERIAPEWWRQDDQTPTRDYFRIEDGDGRRFWLFRQGLYGAAAAPPRWFIHGIFA